ncbi:P-type conjugative transfer protein TrbL [Brevundimonas sp.]|jgi:type IV secretion system protein TrbL|uniref:P-type conjugative transfer protein TrbL n=1 Tax=Brevundimonas sp. TaxID=1871086 RepID=UPI002E122B54|nr:P-type conjugative transfer protein TrbL [Brevundimonas sp.]
MNGMGVIDRFLEVFTRYIDSGFGLLNGEVAFLASTLIVIDVTLAALFWAWGADEDILARLVKKTLFVGAFAFIISNWNTLSRIVFESFAGLGLQASGTGMSAADFLRPGRIAQTGLEAGRPILDSISGLMGFISFFENFIQIAILLFAWAIVILSFFILAIQLFISLIEFKLATLCGFVLVPFGLFNKTAFMAERVLGLVISSGVKVLVLAVIVGIGSTLFGEFTRGFTGQPTIEDAMALVLAALSLLGLGIFAPGIANGIVSGGPQLGAGAAVGTGLAAGGMVIAGGAAAMGGARLAGAAVASGARGATSVAGGASAAYATGSAASGGSVAGGLSGVARTGASAASSPLRRAAETLRSDFQRGGQAVTEGGGDAAASAANDATSSGEPGWARAMRRRQAAIHGLQTTAHALKSGDAGGAGSSVSVREGD